MRKPEGKWLVAVSGGSDSMALLSMCLDAHLEVAVAHVNYHHRNEADIEEAYVRSFCDAHGISCHVRNEPFTYTGNFEAAARLWRYAFFESVVQEYGYEGVFVGHQEDDVLETFLMQEEKGLIPETYGLKEEMRYHGMRVKRPLLEKTKEELKQYCVDHAITYFEDSTNASDDYARNRIRHSVVEGMTSLERNLVLHEIQQKNAELKEQRCRVSAWIQQGKVSRETYCSMQASDRLALLRAFLQPDKKDAVGLRQAYLKELDEVILQHRDFVIPLKEKAIVQNAGFFFQIQPKKPYAYVFSNAQEVQAWEDSSSPFRVCKGEPGLYAVTTTEEDYPLTIRSVRDGDAIALRFGTKLVHRFFVDRKIPQYQRETWPVVVNRNNEVILVPGLGCDCLHYSLRPDFNVIQYYGDQE